MDCPDVTTTSPSLSPVRYPVLTRAYTRTEVAWDGTLSLVRSNVTYPLMSSMLRGSGSVMSTSLFAEAVYNGRIITRNYILDN